jgi:SNF2 family DNA or RNA helicase
MKLEDITPGTSVRGLRLDAAVSVEKVDWHGSDVITVIYRGADGRISEEILYRHDESRLEIVEQGRPWSFDGDGSDFRLVAEAYRIKLAHLFDPVLAVHTSLIDALPHQITAVYEVMLQRKQLRFLLADDPGAGKTIMAGLLIRELITRGDIKRCLIVCPGSLVEQWQDELWRKFQLPFEILTNDKLEAAGTGNWFLEHGLMIARLDKLSRNEDVQRKLDHPDLRFDLAIFDEAHKCSASYNGGEVKYTKRYQLARKISELSRQFLLMTATPHNGKPEDFHLFMALLDGDRFEGKYRDGVHQADVSDLMRRMVKEKLVKFDGTPLFPERIAYTVPYKLSDAEAHLYKEVTDYVRTEFDRAKKLEDKNRKGTVGFALTILQRRLASSPEAIFASLKRRGEKLESRLRELELKRRGSEAGRALSFGTLDDDDIEDLEDGPEGELAQAEAEILDQTTAAQTIEELRSEIGTLQRLTELAGAVRRSGEDRKWRELSLLLGELFSGSGQHPHLAELAEAAHSQLPLPTTSPRQKIVIFTEHRDTLNYLQRQIGTLLGRPEAVSIIHGGMGREERTNAQNSFLFMPEVQVLLATDAAGEGINLQRAHLMVNYDLPWNPNRLEQRFGRIHRIKQTEVCHLWNLVAMETREGDVYRTLLDKLAEARDALGGQVFDVLGKLQFVDQGEPCTLKDLLVNAVAYGNLPETRERLNRVVAQGLDREHLRGLIADRALQQTSLSIAKVDGIRAEMERAEARRLQPHFIESFFREAFQRLGGVMHPREPRRYEITNVPGPIRARDRQIGVGDAVQSKYERVTFEKDKIAPAGAPLAAFLCPGNPLLDSVLDLTLERYRELLKRGTVLVDANDSGTEPRMLFFVEHAIRDGVRTQSGEERVISRQLLYVEIDRHGTARDLHYAPYLDYRPLEPGDPTPEAILARPECGWINRESQASAVQYAITRAVPDHIKEVRDRRLDLVQRTRAAVHDRLTKEINHWDHRAQELQAREAAGRPGARLNSGEARKRADELAERLRKRLAELDLEGRISSAPPSVIGGLVVVPIGMLRCMQSGAPATDLGAADTQASAERARAAVMAVERALGFEPVDRELEKLGYDIESRDPRQPHTGHLRLIEVKGRVAGADTITVTKNEILFSLNRPDHFILAMVEFQPDGAHRVRYLRRPFDGSGITTDFNGASVNFPFGHLLSRAEEPS